MNFSEAYTPDAVLGRIRLNQAAKNKTEDDTNRKRLKEPLEKAHTVFMERVKEMSKSTEEYFHIETREICKDPSDAEICLNLIANHLNSVSESSNCKYAIESIRESWSDVPIGFRIRVLEISK